VEQCPLFLLYVIFFLFLKVLCHLWTCEAHPFCMVKAGITDQSAAWRTSVQLAERSAYITFALHTRNRAYRI